MAKVNGNIFVDRLSGMVGNQMIIRKVRGGRTIISAKPTFSGEREYSEAQLAQHQAFREATAYAKVAKEDQAYIDKAFGTAKTAYNLAVADWFNKPKVLEVDKSGWTNGSGGVIRVRAQDDFRVESVKVMITDENGTVLEEGEAQDIGALWWEYNVSEAFADTKQVSVAARDLPGHVTTWTEMNLHPRMP